jgi:hypothetical protein
MRIRLSNSARQNGPLKMEINIRRRLISIANRKRRLFIASPTPVSLHSKIEINYLFIDPTHTHSHTDKRVIIDVAPPFRSAFFFPFSEELFFHPGHTIVRVRIRQDYCY